MHKFQKWLIVACCCSLIMSCNDDDSVQDKPQPETARRTVILYISAENSLATLPDPVMTFDKLDSIEISNGCHHLAEDDRLILFKDDGGYPRIYEYTRSQKTPTTVKKWDHDIDSSDPNTLQEVLTWAKQYYPAKEYGLVMWSHSSGWVPSTNKNYQKVSKTIQPFSFGMDAGEDGNMSFNQDKFGNLAPQMDIEDMAVAIQNSGIHFYYIFFDSCLMQNLETGYALRNVTDYIIAAPMTIPGPGANYTHMLKKGLFTKAEYDIVETYSNDTKEGLDDRYNEYFDYGLVISSIRTDKLEQLAQTTAELLPQSTAMEKNSPNMNNVLYYQQHSGFLSPHQYDAQEAMRKMLSDKDFATFQRALDEVIVHKGTTDRFWIGGMNYQYVDENKYCGIAAFIPQDIYYYTSQNKEYGDLNKAFKSTSWYKAAGWNQTGW